jgi:hypothetical protein
MSMKQTCELMLLRKESWFKLKYSAEANYVWSDDDLRHGFSDTQPGVFRRFRKTDYSREALTPLSEAIAPNDVQGQDLHIMGQCPSLTHDEPSRVRAKPAAGGPQKIVDK